MNAAGYKVYDAAYRARPKAQQALAQAKELVKDAPARLKKLLKR